MIKRIKNLLGKKQARPRKEPRQTLSTADYDGMGDFTRFGRP